MVMVMTFPLESQFLLLDSCNVILPFAIKVEKS